MEQIQTFDLIGFKGCGVISKVLGHLQVRALSKRSRIVANPITHVGLAIRGEDITNLPDEVVSILKNRIDPTKVYIFESNRIPRSMDKVPDVFGSYHQGVKLRPLDEIVQNFKGHVYYSPHKFPSNKEMISDFVTFIILNNHEHYEKSPIVLMASIFRCLRRDKSTDSVFCSELVAKVLIYLKVLNDKVNPEYVVPLDFYINPSRTQLEAFDVDKEIPVLFDHEIQIK